MAAALPGCQPVSAAKEITAAAGGPIMRQKAKQSFGERVGENDLFPMVKDQHAHRRGIEQGRRSRSVMVSG